MHGTLGGVLPAGDDQGDEGGLAESGASDRKRKHDGELGWPSKSRAINEWSCGQKLSGRPALWGSLTTLAVGKRCPKKNQLVGCGLPFEPRGMPFIFVAGFVKGLGRQDEKDSRSKFTGLSSSYQ